MDKSETCFDVVYVRYFLNLLRIHEYNRGGSCLAYLHAKLNEASKVKPKQMVDNKPL